MPSLVSFFATTPPIEKFHIQKSKYIGLPRKFVLLLLPPPVFRMW